jgi:hypothetical protein
MKRSGKRKIEKIRHTKVTLYKHKNMEQVGRNYLLLPNSFSIELECAHVVGTQHFKLQYNTLYRDYITRHRTTNDPRKHKWYFK